MVEVLPFGRCPLALLYVKIHDCSADKGFITVDCLLEECYHWVHVIVVVRPKPLDEFTGYRRTSNLHPAETCVLHKFAESLVYGVFRFFLV